MKARSIRVHSSLLASATMAGAETFTVTNNVDSSASSGCPASSA